jgi:hypothetical protein
MKGNKVLILNQNQIKSNILLGSRAEQQLMSLMRQLIDRLSQIKYFAWVSRHISN